MDIDPNPAKSTISIEDAFRYAAIFVLLALVILVVGGGLLVAAIAFVLNDQLVVGAIAGFLALVVLLLGSIALTYKFLVDAVGRGFDVVMVSAETDLEPADTRED